MNAFFYILYVQKLRAASSQTQAKMQKVCFDMTDLQKSCVSELITTSDTIFSCSFSKILLCNPMVLLLFQNITMECMMRVHFVTCLMASLEYMRMFLSVLLGLNSLSIIYPLFSSVLQ